MRKVNKIVSFILSRRFFSIALMLFLLGFLTVGNAFIYDEDASEMAIVSHSNDDDNKPDDNNKRPISSDEEKSSSSKSVSGNLTEEYLHEQELLLNLYVSSPCLPGDHVHTHGLGDDHSRLHCPPPDYILS